MSSGDLDLGSPGRSRHAAGSVESKKDNESRLSSRALAREMTYHYAGKVHVRGLLRRVWRPRYLALGDDGYLRYHESIPPLIQQESQHGSTHDSYSSMHSMIHHTHRPKSILAVLDGARIIDPYSMMDRHVALPQGMYGFVFRGRPVELYTAESLNNKERAASAMASRGDIDQGALIVPPEKVSETAISNSNADKHSTKAAVVNLVFPKGTSRRRTAQKIAKKAINPDVLCGFGVNNCEGGISRSSSSSSLMGYEQSILDEDTNELYSNNEWGRDSHESHNTIGSFQEVEGSHVYRDLDDNTPSQKNERREKMQNSATKSTIQVQVQPSSIQSREYLCAVATSEEAESWVVALRWAAEHRRRIKYGNSARVNEGTDLSSPSTPNRANTSSRNMISEEQLPVSTVRDRCGHNETSGVGNYGSDHGSESTSKRSSSSSGRISRAEGSAEKDGGWDSKASLTSLLIEQEGWCKAETGKHKTPPSSASTSNENLNEQILAREDTTTLTQAKPPPLPSLQDKKSSSLGSATIVVTKVSRMKLPPNALVGWGNKEHQPDTSIPWFPIHFPLPGDELLLHYEIQLLLLRHCRPRNEIAVQPESISHQTIYKSIHDVLGLVNDLMSEFDTSNRDNLSQEDRESDQCTPTHKGRAGPILESNDTFHLLEDVQSNLLSCSGFRISNKSSHHGKQRSVVPTGALSELSSAFSEATASVGVIDSVMRKLSKDSNICSSYHFQEFLCLNSNRHHTSPPTTSNHKSTLMMVPKDADAEQIVRKWLAKTDLQSTRSKVELVLAITSRHKLAGPILSLLTIWSATRITSTLWFIVSGTVINVSLPLETYAVLIALSFFFGHTVGLSSQSQYDEHGVKSKGQKELSPKAIAERDAFPAEPTVVDDDHSTVAEEGGAESEDDLFISEPFALSSPLPLFPANNGITCWSKPDHKIFMVRGPTYLDDRIKFPSAPAVFQCRGVDVWITENAERNIARHPSVLGGELDREHTFIVNFLLPFANFVAYFTIPPVEEMPANIADVWCKFIKGDQQYRDGKLKLLPVVVDGPWIVRKAVGPGTSPAMIGRDLPLQYYFTEPTATKKGAYEVDVLVTASRIARGILNVVKGHTKSLTIAFAFIIEASEEAQLPETVLCAFQVHELHLEDCPNLPDCYPDG